MWLKVTTWLVLAFCSLRSQDQAWALLGVTPPALIKSYKIVDLSHHFNNETIYWDDNGIYNLNVTVYNTTRAGWLQMDVVEDPIHGGTHFDAPLHFNKDGWDVSQVPLEMLLFVPVARVDVRHKVASDPAYLLTVDDILDREKQHARLPDGCLFIAHTGHSKYWPNRTAYLGIQADGERRFPALTGDAASFLATQRSVNGVGLDTASVDASRYDAHRAILNANMFILENLVNLEKLPTLGSYAIVLPLMLDGGSGSPVRVVAIVPRRKNYIYHSEDNYAN
ncbi:isatin hydrolase [Rhipicephalus microplus]|uniref:isatin hydrolase n=1 Tax=Rhipicephalus microplus TaxID=6941 RepID=UPI003F6AC86A